MQKIVGGNDLKHQLLIADKREIKNFNSNSYPSCCGFNPSLETISCTFSILQIEKRAQLTWKSETISQEINGIRLEPMICFVRVISFHS